MVRVFLTGASGYVGGEVLYGLRSTAPKLDVVCLVRGEAKARQVKAAHPDATVIEGSLEDTDIVKREAEASDIVLNLAATGHATSTAAIVTGLESRKNRTKDPSYWIQISGATVYAAEEIAAARYGCATDQLYDDLEDQEKILSLIRTNPKRIVESTVLSTASTSIRTSLIIGPLIYGEGRGPVNRRSVQAPEMVKATLKVGQGFKLGDGKNIWSNVHVRDLGDFICALVQAAVEHRDGIWNEQGVYNVENGQMSFGDLNVAIVEECRRQGFTIADAETITAQKADSLSPHAAVLWGTNAVIRSSRARKLLGWNPSAPALSSTIPALVVSEAKLI